MSRIDLLWKERQSWTRDDHIGGPTMSYSSDLICLLR